MLLSLLSSEQLNTCISWEGGGGGNIFFKRYLEGNGESTFGICTCNFTL